MDRRGGSEFDLKILHGLMRGYANTYVLVLSVFFLGIGVLAKDANTKAVNLPMLPWTGEDLVSWLFYLGGFGLLAVALNVTGLFRYLLPLAAITWLVVLFRGFFLNPYNYGGEEPFYWAVALVAGAFGATLCALRELFSRKKKA